MSDHYFGATHPGRVRQNNEDTFFVQPVLQGACLGACVIDGVGGYEGGEVAAAIARDVLLDYLSVPSGTIDKMMEEGMVAANERINAERNKNPRLSDMACVATLALVDEANNQFHYIHVGDTRLYLYRDGSLVKVSRDQSFVGFLEDSGKLTEEAAMQHLKRNEIDKALGFDGQLRSGSNFFDSGSSPFLPGDHLLLCSDGLTDLVRSDEINKVLATKSNLKQKVQTLVDAANQAGGKDNITVVLVRHSRVPQKQLAVKPKKKPGRKPKPKVAVEANVQKSDGTNKKEKMPAEANSSKKRKWLPFLLLGVAIMITAWLAYRFMDKETTSTSAAADPRFNRLQQLMAFAGDTLRWVDDMAPVWVRNVDTLLVRQDSLVFLGNGLHLKGDSTLSAIGFNLATTSKYLLLQDVVLENFATGIMARGQTVQLRNVQFLNCSVPVEHGFSVPVNSPANLLIKDSIFSYSDTLKRK